jgi:hypothetical protein
LQILSRSKVASRKIGVIGGRCSADGADVQPMRPMARVYGRTLFDRKGFENLFSAIRAIRAVRVIGPGYRPGDIGGLCANQPALGQGVAKL